MPEFFSAKSELELRIPAGCEFNAPKPELDNHFTAIWAYYPKGKTLHIDDSLMYFDDPPFVFRLAGIEPKTLAFHPALEKYVLNETPQTGMLLSKWFQQIIADWDFENIAAAHNGVVMGGGTQQFIQT